MKSVLPHGISRTSCSPICLFALTLLCSGISNAVTLGQIDNFSQSSQRLILRSVEAERTSMPLQDSSLLQGWNRNLGIDADLIPAERSVSAEIAAEYGMFFLSYGPGVNARTWLEYVAPEGLSFDLTMANAANCLELLVEFSQAPFEVHVSMESLSGLGETRVFQQQANYSRQQVEFPYEIFTQTDLQNVTSLTVEIRNIAGQGAPDIIISELSVGGTNNQVIPEPSTSILLLLTASGVCLRRRREGL